MANPVSNDLFSNQCIVEVPEPQGALPKIPEVGQDEYNSTSKPKIATRGVVTAFAVCMQGSRKSDNKTILALAHATIEPIEVVLKTLREDLTDYWGCIPGSIKTFIVGGRADLSDETEDRIVQIAQKEGILAAKFNVVSPPKTRHGDDEALSVIFTPGTVTICNGEQFLPLKDNTNRALPDIPIPGPAVGASDPDPKVSQSKRKKLAQ